MATGIPAAPVPSSTSTNCKLCGGYYGDPRLLHCLHTFCKSCLDSVVKENEEKTTCPTCHKVSPHPPHRLPRHVRLENEAAIARRLAKIQSEQSCGSCDSKEQAEAYCHQCDAGLCAFCVKCHKTLQVLRDHKVEALTNISTSLTSSLVYCTDHSDEVLKYYCTTCSSLICHECYMFKHKEHKYCRIQEAMKVENADITNSLPSLKKAHSTVSQTKEKVESVMLSITNRREAIKSHINDIFQSIIAALEKRHQELLKEVDVFALTKSSPLQTQLDSLNELVSDIECVMSTCSEASEEFSPTEFLAIKCTLSEVVSLLMKQVEGTKLEAVSNDDIYCTLDSKPVLSAITKLSSVSSSPKTFDCSLVDINPKQPIGIPNSGKCSLVLEICDKTGRRATVEEHVIHSKLTDKSSSNVSEVSVRCKEEGRYELIIAPPTSEGSYLLHVQLINDNIKDSPYSINVRDYSKIKEPILTVSVKPHPACLYVDDEENIYVTFDDGSIVVYNDKGKIARTIPADKLNVKRARGIAVDKANNIMYIASADTNKIVKATLDGKFITSVGEKGSGELQFDFPMGLHFSKDELLYVAGNSNKRVQVLGSDLSFVRSIKVKCQSTVYCVSTDSTGNIHIGTNKGIIEIFSSVGHYIGQYGSGIVQSVGDIAFMRNSDCVVSNSIPNTGSILVFQGNDKTLLHSFGNNNQDPFGIFIDQAGYIYVAEYNGSRVLKY